MPTTPRERTLNPPLIMALAALLVLAAVTIWVVLRQNDAVDAGASGAGNAAVSADAPAGPSVTDSSAPAGLVMDSSDGSFSATIPAGYADGKDVVSQLDGMVLSLYDTATGGEELPTHIIVASADDDGTSLSDAVAQVISGFESTYSTSTQESEIEVTSIDGEPAQGWQSGDYQDGATAVNSTQFTVVHDGKFYFFTVNSSPEHTQAARAALEQLMQSTVWN